VGERHGERLAGIRSASSFRNGDVAAESMPANTAAQR